MKYDLIKKFLKRRHPFQWFDCFLERVVLFLDYLASFNLNLNLKRLKEMASLFAFTFLLRKVNVTHHPEYLRIDAAAATTVAATTAAATAACSVCC